MILELINISYKWTIGRKFSLQIKRFSRIRIGTKIFGKRETPVIGNRDVGVVCRPMEMERLSPIWDTFQDAQVIHHGAFTRYPLIALGKLKFRPKRRTLERITQIDDRLASKLRMRKYGSGIAMLAESEGLNRPNNLRNRT